MRVRLEQWHNRKRIAEGIATHPPMIGFRFRVDSQDGGALTPTVTKLLSGGRFEVRGGKRYRIKLLDSSQVAALHRRQRFAPAVS